MKQTPTFLSLIWFLIAWSGAISAQNQITYGFVQDPVDQLKLTAVAYPNFTSNNVTISTALFTFYLPAGTVTDPSIPVLPAFGSFTDVTGTWRIEKITPALYASFGFNPADLQGNDIYQCILQNSPSPNTTNGQPVSLFSFRLPGDCMGGTVQVHINDNAIQMALLNNVGININNQMSVSVNDAASVDLYSGNNPATDDYSCPLDDVPVAVDDVVSTNEDTPLLINVTGNDSFGTDGPSNSAITITTTASHGTATVNDNGTPGNPTDDKIMYTPAANYNGPDVIVYQICDADNDCDLATVNITVNAVNDPPSAPNTTATTPEDTPVNVCVNITDVDNSSFTTTVLCAPAHGTVSGLTNPATTQFCLTYTPAANYNGSDMLCVLVCDGSGGCDTSYITITVTPVNDPPSAPNTTVTTPEDTPVNVCVNITDVDNSSFTTTLLCAPAHGTVSGLTNPSTTQFCLTYTPAANYNGSDMLCVLVCDGAGGCDTSYVTITVTPVNDPPSAPNTTATTPEDTPVNVCVNITDVDNSSFTTTLLCAPTHGTVSGLTNPSTTQFCLTYTPAANYNGSDMLCVLVCDGSGGCDTSYITITVTPVNDPPSAPNTTATTPEDTPVNVCVNITDVDNSSFTTTLLCAPAHGTVSGLTNPSTTQFCLTYTPAANYNGSDMLCVLVCDGAGGCDTSYVTITVTPVNDPPSAPNTTATTPEDTPVNVCVNITDVDNSSFTTTLLCAPAHGTVSGLTNPSTTQYCLTYTPAANYNGSDMLCVLVCDGAGGCDTSYITITVTPVNDPPSAPNTTATTPEDTPVNVCVNITDVDNSSFTTTLLCAPAHGTVSGLTNPSTTQYCLTYTPAANYNGSDMLCVLVCDGAGGCDTSYVTITVTPVNDPPVANDDSANTPEDTPITFNVTANDTDVDGMIDNASVDLDPNTAGIQTTFSVSGGTFTYNGGGSVTFTPNAGFNGTATAQYQVCDNGTPLPALCDLASITVSIDAVNDPPVANDDNASTNEDMAVTFNITTNDTDSDGMIDNASVDLDPNTAGIQTTFSTATGTFTYNGGGSVTFTPNANANGMTTATYQVCDNGTPLPAQCDQAVITVNVNAVNDAPIANDDSATTPEDTPVTFNITANDTDVDGMIDNTSVDLDPNTAGIQTTFTTASGTFTYNGGGSVTFTPNANANGMTTATYQVCDNGTPLPAQCDQAVITVNVSAVNDAPIANDDSATTPEDTPVTFNITANDTDVDGMIDNTSVDLDPNTPGIQTTFSTATGTFTYNGGGSVTFTPNANANGTTTATYQVCDNGTPLPAQCDQAVITVNVNAVNDAPIANDDNATTPEDTPVTFNVTANDTDVDGMIDNASLDLDPNTAGIQTTFSVSGGTFTYNGGGSVTFTPNSGFNGTATAQYQVCDNGTPLPALCDLATITVSVNAVNDPPIANDDNASTNEDMAVTFNITANDTDSDGMIDNTSVDLNPNIAGIQTTFSTATGTFTYNGGGSVTFTPNANANGTTTATYQVCDNGTPLPAQCDQAVITVNVNAINDAPVANDDNATTSEDTPVTFNITSNDTDLDGMIDNTSVDLDLGTPGIQTSITVAGGVFTYNGGGSVTFTPNANFNGSASTQYLVCDNGTPLPPLCDNALITVTVNAVNDPPVANDDNASTNEDTPVSFSLTANDSDADGMLVLSSLDLDPNTPGIQTTFTVAGKGTFIYDGNGNVAFTPVLNFNGTVNASYQICDNGTPLPAQCDLAAILVTVNSVNDAPIANDDNATTNEDTPVTVPVLNNDSDVDGMVVPSSVVISDAPNHGTATVNTLTGAITYTPNTDYVGNDTLIYTVCDNGTPVLCDNAVVILTINATSVRLLAKMRLQGAMYNSPDTLMRDNLRAQGRIPKKEPYTSLSPSFVHVGGGGNEMVSDSATVFGVTGANAIVDWVFIELRSPSNPATVVHTRAALLQRDGDVVDVDGVSPLVFENTNPALFYVAIRHRNHLGSMTANSVQMVNGGTVIDFSNLSTALWDDGTNLNGFEQVTINGKYALWAGNVNKNNSVVFAGQNNDKDPVFNLVDQAPGNIFHSQSYVYNGYHLGDVNMDGKAIFAGQTNDVDFIFNNVDGHPKNVTHSQSYVIRQQLAE